MFQQINLKFINRYADTWPAGISALSGGILNLDKLVTHTFALEHAIFGIGQITGDLIHPQPIRGVGNTSHLDAARGDLNEEQNHVAPETLPGPNLHGKEIGCDDLFPMLNEELLPGSFADSFRRGFNAVALQYVCNRAVRKFMAEI